MGRIIGNHYVITPQAIALVDDSALGGVGVDGSGSVAIVGESLGGAPKTPLYFTSGPQAAQVLKGGELLTAVQRAFGLSASEPGAPVVYAIRVNAATQATATLAAGAKNAVALVSQDYGVWNNQIRVKVEATTAQPVTFAGSAASVRQITVQYAGNININPAVYRRGLQVKLVDAATPVYTAATVGISGTTLTLTLTPVAGGNVVKTVDLTVFQTLQAVSDQLNAFGSGIQSAVASFSPQDPSTYLDETVTPISIYCTLANALTQLPTDLWANAIAVQNFFNQNTPYVTATTPVTNPVRMAPDVTGSWTYLTGGTDYGQGNLVPSNQDWTDALNAALPIDVSIITPVSSNTTIHAMVQSHINLASEPWIGSERVAFLGGAMNETIGTVQGRALALGDQRCMLVYPGAFDIDPSAPYLGTVVAVPPYMLAAQLAGQMAGGPIADPLTHHYIAVKYLEQSLSRDNVDLLIQAGVCPLQQITNRGIRVAKSCSTWIYDTNYRHVEISTMRASDELIKRIRQACNDQLIGRVVSPALLAAAYSVVDSVLTRASIDGLIVGQPAFQNITISAQADFIQIDFQAAIAIPANFVQITAHLTQFSSVTQVF